MELLKEIPGYKAILKSVIKTQIQLLVEQLSDQTGEESIIITASINEGTLSHLGSHMGKGFFEDRDEIKSQFLSYCLKHYHRNEGPQTRTEYQGDPKSDTFQEGPSKAKKQRNNSASLSYDGLVQDVVQSKASFVHNITRSNPNHRGNTLSRKSPIRPAAMRTENSSVSTPVSDSNSDSNIPAGGSDIDSGIIVKLEHFSEVTDSQATVENNAIDSVRIPMPSSVGLSYTEMTTYTANERVKETDQAGLVVLRDENSQTSVKIEPVTEDELDLEITGVEMTGGSTRLSVDWQQNNSNEAGYQSTIPGENSQDQSGNQINIPCPISSVSGRGQTSQVCNTALSPPKIYACGFCGKAFPRKTTLHRHVKIHIGQKDIKCQFCSKAFSRRDHLKSHVMRKHMDRIQMV